MARYEYDQPGAMVHCDTKKLGRIVGGPGHHIHGDRTTRARGVGWEVMHMAIDDATRLVYAEILGDERARTAAVALDGLEGAGSPSLIKIDTEGHESEVIAGATTTLETHSPIVVLECFDRGAQALVTLTALGYALLDAERPDLAPEGCFSGTTNFLALPPRLLDKLPTLLDVWHEMLALVRSR